MDSDIHILHRLVECSCDDLKLMFTAEFHEVDGITGHADRQLRIFLRMFHGILKHLAVKDIDIQMMRALGEIAVHHCHEILDSLLRGRAERLRNDGERVADTVLGIIVIKLGN